jgi:hypothetical protein
MDSIHSAVVPKRNLKETRDNDASKFKNPTLPKHRFDSNKKGKEKIKPENRKREGVFASLFIVVGKGFEEAISRHTIIKKQIFLKNE